MALAPHWLDDIFEGTRQNEQRFSAHARVKAAFAAADAAFTEAQKNFKNNPGLMSASPAQAARQAFLESLGLQIADADT